MPEVSPRVFRSGLNRMVSRILIFCAACLLAGTPVGAEPTVFFRGKQLTYRHYVYGEVTAATGRAGTINLGYAHGLQQEQEVGVLRPLGTQLLPIGVLRLTSVRPGDAFGEFEGEFPIHRGDIMIVSARDLNLWRGMSRSDQLVIDSMLNRNRTGYDTGDVSPTLLNELGRDDGLISKKRPPLHGNLDLHFSPRPKFTPAELRGAFRLASGDDDGAANGLSAKDRELSIDKPTLALETSLAGYVATSGLAQFDADNQSVRSLADDLSGVFNLDESRANLNRANARVHALLQPK